MRFDVTLQENKKVYEQKITQFKWLAATIMLVAAMVMPSVAWAQSYDENGFGSDESNPYQPAKQVSETYHSELNGTHSGYYAIENVGQLYWFADKVNNDNTNFGSANAVLTANITVNTGVLDKNGNLSSNTSSFRSWTPIGGYYNSTIVKYSGTFDGDNHTISGLYYNVTSNESYVYVGLFGRNNGTIKNVGVEDSYFGLDFRGYAYWAGCVIGANGGTIENCYNEATITVKGTIEYESYAGGVCGNNGTGIIKNCHNAGKVTATDFESMRYFVGGVSGQNGGVATIENCLNTGEVSGKDNVGGVCGRNYAGYDTSYKATIKDSYNTGKVSGTNKVGGICGYNTALAGGIVEITNCYNTGEVTGTGWGVGGVSGYSEGSKGGATSTIANCYNSGKVNGNYVSGVIGDNYDTAPIKVTNCYYLSVTATDDGGKTEGQFKSGEVCYLLNISTSENTGGNTLSWYQNINNGSIDNYPLLDSSHGTVYASVPCPSSFSNTNDLAAKEHNFVANTEYTKHTCTKCGETHDAAFTVNDETNIISACHGFGSVTLKAPTENLTYDGTAKEAAVEGALTGIDTPKILYKLKDSSETATETAPLNAGTYIASITYTISGTAYSVSVEFTIEQADDVPNRPNELYGCIGEKLSIVSLKASEGWSWDNPESKLPKNVENITVKASYNGADKDNYKNITAVDVTINLIPLHNYTNGFCEFCGGYMPARIVSIDHHPHLIGTHDGYYAIDFAGQLYWFAGLVNGTLEGVTRNKSANAVLTDNITVNEGVLDTNGKPNSGTFRNWTPICEFDMNDDTGYSGTFDGNNKTISGLYFNDTNTGFVGLFGDFSGTVKNVGIVDSYFNGKAYVGGVCGSTRRGTIQNCYNTATVNGTNAVGGVCGYMDYSGIINCYNVGAVSGGSNVCLFLISLALLQFS